MKVVGKVVKSREVRVESKSAVLSTIASRPSPLKDAICEATALCCKEEFGGCLRSVVLTGSLARDEATFICEGKGWNLLGDAEFLLVLHGRATLPSSLCALRERIESALGQSQIVCHVSLSVTHPDYLLKMRPHIFGYELRTCGQVVCGEPAILSLIPAFSPSDIPLEDGWRLLANRIIELLEVPACPQVSSNLSPVPYSVVKLFLDMCTSFLLFQGAYEPTYRRREARLRSLAATATNQDGYPFFPLHRFAERVTACTDSKLGANGQNGQVASTAWSSMSAISWEEVSAYVRTLWRWELARLIEAAGAGGDGGGVPRGCPEELPGAGRGGHQASFHGGEGSEGELLRRWMRLQPLGQRLRGWAYVLRRRGWHRSWRQWPRWLRRGWRASPRYGVYAAASELFFQLGDLFAPDPVPGNAPGDFQKLASWLPMQGTGDNEPGTGDQEQGSASRPAWQRLASAIAWNYHEFLEGTRA